MRKWLVGLLAASVCAASSWAVTDTLTAGDLGATSTTYKDFSGVQKTSDAVYAGNSAKAPSGAIQLRSKDGAGIVTTASGGTATKVTLSWADGNTEGRTVDVYGKTEAYSASTDLYNSGTQGTKLGSIALGSTDLEIEGEYTFIGLRSNNGALYLNSVAIDWDGEPTPVEFSIALDPAEDFEVFQGRESSIAATVTGAQGDVTYSWSVDGTPIELEGNVYTIDSTEVGGPYEVACEASDGVSDPVSASVSYSVVEAPVVSGDVLTRETTGVTGNSYTDWTATGDSGTKYAGQSAGGNESIQLRATSPAGIVITESAGSDVASVTVEWNDATSEGRAIQIYGSTEAYASPADLYGDAKGTLLGEIAKGETTLDVPEGYPYVGIRSKSGALYLTSVAIGFGGAAEFSVTLDKDNGFTVDFGSSDSITATAKNGVEPYTYEWTSDTAELNGTGETLNIPATLAVDDYTVQVEATDAESNRASKQIYFSVVAPAEKYDVVVADGILNGVVEVDKAQAEADETVTVTATPEAGYRLVEIIVNNGEVAVSGNTFVMPADDVLVTATFELKPVVAGFTKITSLDQLTPGEYVITGAKAVGEEYAMMASVSTSKTAYIERRETAVELEGDVVTDAEDAIIWTLAQGDDGWTVYNEAVGYAGYVASGNSSGVEAEPSTKSSWTITASETEGLFLLNNVDKAGRYLLYNASSPRFACYTNLTSGKHLALYKGSSGPSIAYTGETEKTLPDGSFELVFTLNNYEGDFEWSLIEGEGTLGEGGMYQWTATEAGEYTVKVAAINGELELASKTVTLKVYGPVVVSPITIGEIANGEVVASIDGEAVTVAPFGATVTLTATADAGYKFSSMSVTYGDTVIPIDTATGTFEMPGEEVFVSAEFVEKPVVAGFTKITSLDQLTPGEYVITGAKAVGEEYAMMASVSTSKTAYIERRETAVELEGDVVTDAEDAIIWTLAQGDDGWTIYNEAVGYAGYVASGNSSGAEAAPSAKSSWTITASTNAGLFLLNNVDKDGRYLLYNASSPRFACYTNLNSGKHLALYQGSSTPAAFSIKLDPADYFEVEVGEEASITATPKNAEGEVHYAWTVDGEPAGSDSAVLGLDTSAITDEAVEVVCTATDAANAEATASVSYKVVAPAQKYTVTVADGILNGSVELKVDGETVASPAELAEGTQVTVVATPAQGYQLDQILLNGEELAANPFTVTGNATVSATFEESQDVNYTKISSADELVPGDYVITGAKAEGEEYAMKAEISTTSTAYILRNETALAPVDGVIATSDASIVWTLEEGDDGWTIYNKAVGYIGYVKSGNSAGAEAEASTKSSWSITSDEGVFSVDNVATPARHLWYNNSSPRFACYTNPTLTSTYRSLNFYKAESSTDPKITFTGDTTVQLPDGAFRLAFTLANYDGDFEWVVDSREGGAIDQDGVYTWAPTEAGEVTIKVVARNGELDIASKEVDLTVEAAPGPQPGDPAIEFGGDTTGVVGSPVNFTVTPVDFPVGVEVEVFFEDGEFPEGSEIDPEFGENYATVSFVPDVVGTYTFVFSAEGGEAVAGGTLEIVVTDGPGPQPASFKITGITKTGDNLVLTFEGEGEAAVYGTATLNSQDWTVIEGAEISGTTVTVPMGDQKFIRIDAR